MVIIMQLNSSKNATNKKHYTLVKVLKNDIQNINNILSGEKTK